MANRYYGTCPICGLEVIGFHEGERKCSRYSCDGKVLMSFPEKKQKFHNPISERREEVRDALEARCFPAWVFTCVGCGKPAAFKNGCDMHEVFVTKGDVQGCSDRVKWAINDVRNCAFIERSCHKTNREEQLPFLLRQVTKTELREFLDELVLLGADERVFVKHYNLIRGE